MVLSNIAHTFGDWPDDRAVFGALTLYFAGCDLVCKGCHNSRLKAKPPGVPEMSPRAVVSKILERRADFPDGVLHLVFSGGDPLSAGNAPETLELLSNLEHAPQVKRTIYTGREYHRIKHLALGPFEYLKCGRYDPRFAQESGHRDGAFHLASTNQVLLDRHREVVSQNGIYHYR